MARQYNIRKLVTKNETGDAYGITIPKAITVDFEGVFFQVIASGPDIVLESGTKISDRERRKRKVLWGGQLSFQKT